MCKLVRQLIIVLWKWAKARFLVKNKRLYSWYIKHLELHVYVSSPLLPSPKGMKRMNLDGGWQWAVLQEGNIESGELATL